MTSFSSKTHLLFIGDSITACGRSMISPLGNGYVAKIAHELQKNKLKHKISNRGVGGNTTKDLEERWKKDCLELNPSLISILIGINDTWRRYDQGIEITLTDFEEYYRDILDRTIAALNATIILCEPFLVPLSDEQKLWHIDLDPKRRLIKGLAEEYRLQLLPLHALFKKAAETTNPRLLTEDGVHPTDAGHRLIADAWLQTVMPFVQMEHLLTLT